MIIVYIIALDKCGEGDRIVPPKKRKIGSFARSILGNTTNTSKEIMMIKPKMKSKTNKKCLQQKGTGDQDGELVTHYYNKIEGNNDHNTKNKTASSASASSTKKRKRGSVIMEGSRCSRVNGRGWRCCQQTLVGYSLCEHHLGKGRLRSMTSCARNRDITTAAAAAVTITTVKQQEGDDDDDPFFNSIMNIVAPEEDGRENPLINGMSKKKRKMVKIGSVKARSISSLLGQGDNV